MVVGQSAQKFWQAFERSLVVVGIRVGIDIGALEGVKVYRVRTESPGAAEILRVEDLLRKRHPATGGASKHYASPGFADAAELALHGGIQLFSQRVAVWTGIGGIDAVGIVIVRGGVAGDH